MTASYAPLAVSVTPLPVHHDMRTYKIAASLDRMGLRSAVFEGRRGLPLPDGSEVIQLVMPIEPTNRATESSPGVPLSSKRPKFSLPGRIWRWGNQPDAGWLTQALAMVVDVCFYAWRSVIQPLFTLPAASLYYLHEYSFFPAVWIKCRLHGARLVYDAHDFYRGMEPAEERSRVQSWWNRLGAVIENACIRRADVFVTVSDGVADLFEQATNRRPIVLNNGNDERLEAKQVPGLRQRIGLVPDTPLAVSVGHSKPGFELSGILSALKALPEFHLALLGNNYARDLSNYPMAGELADRIHCVEGVPASEVVPTIKDADVSIILYYPLSVDYLHALPNKFFQSVAAGLPLLYGALPEIDRLCRLHGIGEQIDLFDGDAVTRALRKAVEDRCWAAEQIRRSQTAAKHLSWRREERALAEVLSGLGFTPVLEEGSGS